MSGLWEANKRITRKTLRFAFLTFLAENILLNAHRAAFH
jgi:hypothetical protein